MSFADFLFDKADIYHIRGEEKSPGYGLPSALSFSYPDTPDIVGQECNFNRKNRSVSTVQTEPRMLMKARIKMVYPVGVDIRLNDKIVDCESGIEYTAEQPYSIHGHHMAVYVSKTEQQEVL